MAQAALTEGPPSTPRHVQLASKATGRSGGLLVDILDRTASCNPFKPAGHGHEYVTGELGVGHLRFAWQDLETFERFHTQGLGLRTTDYNTVDLVCCPANQCDYPWLAPH